MSIKKAFNFSVVSLLVFASATFVAYNVPYTSILGLFDSSFSYDDSTLGIYGQFLFTVLASMLWFVTFLFCSLFKFRSHISAFFSCAFVLTATFILYFFSTPLPPPFGPAFNIYPYKIIISFTFGTVVCYLYTTYKTNKVSLTSA
jgi:hypothetical protein